VDAEADALVAASGLDVRPTLGPERHLNRQREYPDACNGQEDVPRAPIDLPLLAWARHRHPL
jgi:hypothetical protein